MPQPLPFWAMRGTRDELRNDVEEPIEPPCWIRVYSGAQAIARALSELKKDIYAYNSAIRATGYYLKPVHMAYRYVNGRKRVYEYYGRYWWKWVNKRMKYIGRSPPVSLPPPPKSPLEGLKIIRDGNDVILSCEQYDKFKHLFEGLAVAKEGL